MTRKEQHLMLPVAAVAVSLLTGCSSMSNLLGQSQPALSPAAKAAAEMPLEKDPVVNTQETYLALVKQMQAKSLWYASMAHLDALDKQWGASSDSRLLRADALRQVGQLNAAVTIYQGLIGSAKDGAARYGLGRVAAEKGDFSHAAQQMEQARMSNPVDSRLLSDLGYAYLQARDLNAAKIPLMQAAQLAPEDVQVNVNLSLFMIVSGQSAQAEEFMRQRKLDGQTQQAVKVQAGEWQRGSKQAESLAAADPARKASGQVVNLSRSNARGSHEAAAGDALQAEGKAAPEGAREVAPAKKSRPESDSVQTPMVVARASSERWRESTPLSSTPVHLPLPVARPMVGQSAGGGSGGGQWMVSGGGFDSGRPRYPGQGQAPLEATSGQAYAYAPPLPMESPARNSTPASVVVTSPVSRYSEQKQPEVLAERPQRASISGVIVDQASVPAQQPAVSSVEKSGAIAALPAQPLRTDASPAQRAPEQRSSVQRQPSGSARSLQEGVAVMAMAPSSAVRQAGGASRQQAVQAMVPSREMVGGLFFETPDEDVRRKPSSSGKATASEPAWP